MKPRAIIAIVEIVEGNGHFDPPRRSDQTRDARTALSAEIIERPDEPEDESVVILHIGEERIPGDDFGSAYGLELNLVQLRATQKALTDILAFITHGTLPTSDAETAVYFVGDAPDSEPDDSNPSPDKPRLN